MSLPTSRPTIALALICKNEEKNLPRLFESVKDCFDEVIFVDTGSADSSKQIAESFGAKVFDFTWVNSFCKARNFAFEKATSDFILWLDCDDVLFNQKGFIQWRDHAMAYADCWFATYNYALDQDGKPIVSFVRERVFKRSLNPAWQYDLHEGIIVKPEWSKDYAIPWSVNHMRDAEDIAADKSRNVKILEEIKNSKGLDPRLHFYYGKELYEGAQPFQALVAFEDASKRELETHDRILCNQYGAYSAIQAAEGLKDTESAEKERLFKRALDFCHEGIKLDPNRAEFHVTCGDIYLRKSELQKAIPYYQAAKKCANPKASGSPYEGAIYSFVDCYGENPTVQLAKIYLFLGDLKASRREALEAKRKYKNKEAEGILQELSRIRSLTRLDNKQTEVEDIIFTCPPQTAYPFDEEIYKTKPLGGSETALVVMAKHLKEITGRPVKVFNMREGVLIADSGVEYHSTSTLNEYLSKYKPKVHIAWRHNIKLTNAPTYLWCHDLTTPTVEMVQNFDKILCLTPFHKNYVMAKQNLPEDKIIVTRNGITPSKFHFRHKDKNPNKLVWMSSPDRGLEQAMLVCDEVKKVYPDVELHVYYGLDNLYKYGMADLAKKLESMMKERPYVKYHGFTEQSKMYHEVSDAVCWVHSCNFIETFCITALEMLALGVYPVTRRLGALTDTLSDAEGHDQAKLLSHGADTKEHIDEYATEIIRVLREKKWQKCHLNLEKHDWRTIASEWKEFMQL